MLLRLTDTVSRFDQNHHVQQTKVIKIMQGNLLIHTYLLILLQPIIDLYSLNSNWFWLNWRNVFFLNNWLLKWYKSHNFMVSFINAQYTHASISLPPACFTRWMAIASSLLQPIKRCYPGGHAWRHVFFGL